MKDKPILYLIPNTLGNCDPLEVLPKKVFDIVDFCWDFAVENEKTARAFIKQIAPSKPQAQLRLEVLNKHTTAAELKPLLNPLRKGISMGIISEAGLPGIADPGAELVALAHLEGFQVVPLVGPSSILLALVSSGMSGQSFAFHGYLPIESAEKRKKLKELERLAERFGQTQLFMETPYRNNKLVEDLLLSLQADTLVGIAADLTLPTEYTKTQTVSSWKKNRPPDLHKRPAIFSLYRK